MSDTARPPARTRYGRPPGPGRIGTVVCAAVLTLTHAVAGYLLFLAYMVGVADPWERDAAAHSGFAAGLALVITVVTALLTWVFVKAGWLRRWWFALPALLGLAALLRLTVLAP